MSDKWIIFAGGGTGGHITQALAVAEQAKAIDSGVRACMCCSNRKIDKLMLGDNPLVDKLLVQPVRPLPGASVNPLTWLKFAVSWRKSTAIVRRAFEQLKPVAVLGLGGFAAGPAVKVGSAKAAVALMNPDAVAGKANMHLAKYCDVIFTAQSAAAKCFGAAMADRIILSGCPVRSDIRGCDAGRAKEFFYEQGLRPARTIIGVMGGSLGAETVNNAAAAAMADLNDIGIIHVCGPGKAAGLCEIYDSSGANALVLEFCNEMGLFYAASDLAITRGGANSVAELAATATPAVIMPYPWHSDEHQRINSGDLEAAGAAVVMTDRIDTQENAENLGRILMEILQDDTRLPAMAVAAGSCDYPDAAMTVARWLIQRSMQ